ncbi:hypothetical protein GCM10027570_21560 [Streptomonospora sediminis]
MRVYLPSTFPGLAAALDTGAVGEPGGAPLTAFAVTERLAGPEGGDDEELEYEALRGAAEASLRLLGADPGAPRRRAVIAAEAPDKIVGPAPAGGADHPAAVTITGTVPLKRVAAVHVDDPAAEEAVAAAIAAEDPDRTDEHELLWYATQELPDILGRR